MCIFLIAFSTTILLDYQESLKHTNALYLCTLIYYSSDDNTKSRNVTSSPLFKCSKLGHRKWQVCTLLFFSQLLNGDTSPLIPAFMRTGTNL